MRKNKKWGCEGRLMQKTNLSRTVSAVLCVWLIQAGRVFLSCKKFQNRKCLIQKAQKISEMFSNCKPVRNPCPSVQDIDLAFFL